MFILFEIEVRMEYLSPIWTGSAGSSLAKLDSVQAKAMKLIGKTEAAKLPLLSHRRAIAGLHMCPAQDRPQRSPSTSAHALPSQSLNQIPSHPAL